AAQEACAEVGATITHHHGVGQLKARVASAEVGPAIDGWRSLRRRLDPDGVMNPGRLFVEAEHREPGTPPELSFDDGLARAPVDASIADRRAADPREPSWPFERLPGPPRWQRLPWHTGWVEIDGKVDGLGCRLGRGPR